MKNFIFKYLFATVLAMLVITLFESCQENKLKKLQQQAYAKWFTSKQVADKVWVIDDHGSDNFYLVEGSDSALLIDDGLGAVNVRDYIAELTKLPVIVVNTHGHVDHGGADYQFPVVYAHQADFPRIEKLLSSDNRKGGQKKMLKDTLIPKEILFTDTINVKPTVLKPVKEGTVFDLGKRKIEVIEVPGHTAGSICLLDRENKLIFTGDDNNSLVWLFLDHCEPLEVYLQSLKKLGNIKKDFNTIFPGHGEPLDNSFVDEEIACVESILNGSCKAEPYKSFVGDALLCKYKRAGVAYNPNNLVRKEVSK
jgi:hydroxyacylglutathione hydrolase